MATPRLGTLTPLPGWVFAGVTGVIAAGPLLGWCSPSVGLPDCFLSGWVVPGATPVGPQGYPVRAEGEGGLPSLPSLSTPERWEKLFGGSGASLFS